MGENLAQLIKTPKNHPPIAATNNVQVGGTGLLITTGEHEYTRYGFRQLLERKCCDMIQPDITWCGGVTEARREDIQ